jgi:phosphoglycolate phosphatase
MDKIPKLVMFDLDGTLIDSVPDLAKAIDHMLVKFELPKAGEERVRSWVGNGAGKLVERALSYHQADVETLQQAAMNEFLRCYEESCAQDTCLYPGVREGLIEFQQRGCLMAIITNKPRRFIKPILQALDIDHYFSYLSGGDDHPNKKPQPDSLLECMKFFNVDQTQALMIGDSCNDIEAAKNANVLVAAVDYGYNHGRDIVEDKPDIIVSSINQVINELTLAINH